MIKKLPDNEQFFGMLAASDIRRGLTSREHTTSIRPDFPSRQIVFHNFLILKTRSDKKSRRTRFAIQRENFIAKTPGKDQAIMQSSPSIVLSKPRG